MMPQSERSAIIKEFLKWLEAKTKASAGATLIECLHHLQLEITDLGAEEKTCRNYLKDLQRLGLMNINGMRFEITDEGRNWLRRKAA